MKTLRCILLISFVTALCAGASAQTAGTTPEKKPDKTIDKCPITLGNPALTYINQASGTIDSPNQAASLIKETFRNYPTLGTAIPAGDYTSEKDFYCLIHVLRWADPTSDSSGAAGGTTKSETGGGAAASESSQKVDSSNWYVYHGGDRSLRDFNKRGRVYGAKRIYFLLIHLNKQPDVYYRPVYEVFVEEVTPTQVANLLAAFSLFRDVTGAAMAGESQPQNVYVADYMDQDFTTSKVTITPRIVKLRRPEAGTCADSIDPAQLCECPVLLGGKPENVADSRVFDNEDRSWWDVSVGIPIKRQSQLDFDSTANVITANKVDKQNLFAFLNLYYPKADIKEGDFGWVPHFVGGISIAKQPLKKYFLGAGWGPRYVQFYIGLQRTQIEEPAILMEGDTATPEQLNNDLKKVWKNSLGFGINVSVKSVVNLLQKQKK